MKKHEKSLDELVEELGSFDEVFRVYKDTDYEIWCKGRREWLNFKSVEEEK